MTTYRNPVLPGFHPDPSVCRVGADYYLAVSSFEYFPGLPLFHSRDLVHWRPIGHALTRRSQLDLTGIACSDGLFAPTLRFHQGRFYLVSTVMGGRGNFLVTADHPAGPWSDPRWIDEGGFDPSLCFDEDGTVYYSRRQGRDTVQARIDVTTGRLHEPLRRIAEPYASNDSEGPHLYRIGGWYYLLNAEGGTGYGHMVTIGRSRSPWGPFVSCPWNPILTHRHLVGADVRYTGHGDLVEDEAGRWWLVFLGTRHRPHLGTCFHTLGRETFLAPVEWTEEWPVVNGGRPVELRLPARQPLHPWPALPEVDRFEQPALDPRWSFIRNPDERRICWTPQHPHLRLTGSTTTLDDPGSPSFLGRRQEEYHFAATVELEIAPQSRGEEAGLALVQSREFHAEICLCCDERGERVVVKRRLLDVQVETASAPAAPGRWVFAVEGDYTHYRFSFGRPGEPRVPLGQCPVRFLASEVATGWTGVMLGPYASASAGAAAAPVLVHEFSYRNRAP